MPAGDAFTSGQVAAIERAIDQAHAESGLKYSVFVGEPNGDLRDQGRRLMGALGADADRAVVILIDPAQRRLEILTGSTAARYLDDRATALGAPGQQLSQLIVGRLRELRVPEPNGVEHA